MTTPPPPPQQPGQPPPVDDSPHVHDPWRCPAHVAGCSCPDPSGSMCNPYRVAGYCPDDLETMP